MNPLRQLCTPSPTYPAPPLLPRRLRLWAPCNRTPSPRPAAGLARVLLILSIPLTMRPAGCPGAGQLDRVLRLLTTKGNTSLRSETLFPSFGCA